MILRHLTRLLALVATALTSLLLPALLATLFATPVFAALPANLVLAQAGPGACAGNSAGRELDFWVGEWSIGLPGAGAGAASDNAASTVSLDLDKCLVVESWRGGKSHSGKNVFGFSQEDKTWHGMFADNEGRVHLFEGKVAAGSADFRGSSRGRNGEAELHRIRIFQLSQDKDKVEQVWEKSVDNGATWAKVFDGVYSRRKQ